MTMEYDNAAPANPERRRFFEVAGKFGVTTALVALAGGRLFSDEAVAQTEKEERERREAADYTMSVASAYRLGVSRSVAIMQLDFKENIQNMTRGRVYVKLRPAGQVGTGSALAEKVQSGTIQAAQFSLANFAPYAPAVDLVNIPYWCGENQAFVNLATSDAWKKQVDVQVEKKGFKPLWYVTIDPRTVALREGFEEPVKSLDQMANLKFRVPGSKILQQVYRMLGANPTPIAWGETPSAIKQGVADALDTSIQGLVVFGFQEVLSWVTFNKAIPNSQVYACNLEWFDGLPKEVREGIEYASEVTMHQNLAKVPSARAYCMVELQKAGVQLYNPTEDELAQWKEKAGHQNPEWDETKKELAGSLANFEKLLEASQTPSRYYVDDV